jgi:Zn-finger nucleic acid-binding protein
MQCPRCSGSLRAEKYQHVEFNVCSACRGIWVSGEQFQGLAVMVAAEGQVESSVKLTFQPRKALLPSNNNPVRICPKCDFAMQEFNYAYDSNVFLDRCEQCKGIWLDPNEIIDIAKHIQYNPELDAIGKGLIHQCNLNKDRGGDEEMEWYDYLLTAAYIILRVLVFKH